MNESFGTYASPSDSTQFSKHYFDSLTLNDCTEIVTTANEISALFPFILPPAQLISFHFDRQVPTLNQELEVGAGEKIPHITDLLRVTREVETAYADQNRKARSVWLELKINGKPCSVRYHFSKLRLVINICNNFPHIQQAAALFLHLRNSDILAPNWVNALGTNRMHEPVQGFQISPYPLHKLACLLDEAWVEDDIGDSLSELAYLRIASFKDAGDPAFIFLPTLFFNDARALFPGRKFSRNLLQIRRRVVNSIVERIGYNVWTSSHYAAYTHSPQINLEHGDSLGHDPAPDVL
ncbi:hypothetical protein DFH06DRAFT_1010794 [Mycena polygramma]|nr:hypothetical protein DFH06DRAFT_1010794 [Mycena polygramma]